MKCKRLLSLVLSLCMLPLCQVHANEIDSSSIINNTADVDIPVTATVSPSFSVLLPSALELQANDTQHIKEVTVGVKGDIDTSSKIVVNAGKSLTLYDVTNRPDESYSQEDYQHKDSRQATVTQNKILWTYNDLKDHVDTYSEAQLSVITSKLPAGNWEGTLNFNISYTEHYIGVSAKNSSGEDINAYANAITGVQRDQLISSLVESSSISSTSDVDALIEVASDDFDGIAETTFEVGDIASEGDKVAILHFNHNNEWELISIETVSAENTITGNFHDYSPVAFVKVKNDGSFDIISQPVELIIGSTYSFGGYNWVAAEQGDGYVTLQSKGVTSGAWPGYKMSGTLTDASGNTIELTNAGTHYTGNIDGYDISNYNATTQSLYSNIQEAEYTESVYGKGLFLISNTKAGSTTHGSQGSGPYCAALKIAAYNSSLFGASSGYAWLGNVNGNSEASSVDPRGVVFTNSSQNGSYVIAPAFNLDTSKVTLDGNTLTIK